MKTPSRYQAILLGLCFASGHSGVMSQAAPPEICSVETEAERLKVAVQLASGHQYAALEGRTHSVTGAWEVLIAGSVGGQSGTVTFTLPEPGHFGLLRIRAGTGAVPSARYSGSSYLLEQPGTISCGGDELTEEQKALHLLNRIAYGPSARDLMSIRSEGLQGYLERQLAPDVAEDSGNRRLATKEAPLFDEFKPARDTYLVKSGDQWRYFKGLQEPPVSWRSQSFDDGDWLQGPSGFGYGDEDDETVLEDMRRVSAASGMPGQPGYLTVYVRKAFLVSDPAAISNLVLRIDYDDGFVAYLNGGELVRANVLGYPPRYSSPANESHEAGDPVEFDVTAKKSLLRPGLNILAVQGHNLSATSSDFTLAPELLSREPLAIAPVTRIRGLDELKRLVHLRGAYSQRQLQTVLAEFWENHFTTDADKAEDYLDDLENSDARDSMGEAQARTEAAQMEYLEYQFFYDNALGNFGDMLLYSASSPPQLIYLDNVLNRKGQPNENYAREILELFAFGADNRYTQSDIEELARCFTGWTVRKSWPHEVLPFPASVRTPVTEESVQTVDVPLLELGPGWRYFKGVREPSPAADLSPTIAWAQPEFVDTAWLVGSTGIGYGDGDDATVLSDMRGRYGSVYLRRRFSLESTDGFENLLLEVRYDDGFVAYLNGVEVARSGNLRRIEGTPPFTAFASANHEARTPEYFSLSSFSHLLRAAPEVNVLAIQAHNIGLNSSDFSIAPRIIDRRTLPGSIENGDPNGVWTFRFDPAEHDTGAKVLFPRTQHEIRIPAGRTGAEGVKDAIDVIDAMARHPSTAEFICLKLINKFVSDDITLDSFHDGTAPDPLRRLMNEAIAAWNSTEPAGNIERVMRVILSADNPNGLFWSELAHRGKVKTAIEFINSTIRALDAEATGVNLPDYNSDLGMELFTRDDPDGWSEVGIDWVNSGTLLERVKFVQTIAANADRATVWNLRRVLTENQLVTGEEVFDYFNRLWFAGQLPQAHRDLCLAYLHTDEFGNPRQLDPNASDYLPRLEEMISLILSGPDWHYQ